MNKEEILAKSRKEKNDEWSLFVENKAMRWGYYAAVIMIAVFEVLNVALQNYEAVSAFLSVSAFVTGFYEIGKAKYEQKRSSWIFGIFSLCMSFLMTCAYIQMILE